jgi:hypothetical protein
MLSFTHLFVGAAVGATTNQPVFAIGLGIISHHLLDALPHVDSFAKTEAEKDVFTTGKYIFAAVEGLAGVAFLIYIVAQSGGTLFDVTSPVAWGALGGVAPDLADNVPLLKERFRRTRFGQRYHAFHDSFHTTLFLKETKWWPFGLIIQVFLIWLSIVILRSR